MQKRKRQEAMLSLIRTERVGNQAVLAERLTVAGFSVTQASVSRDLVELGVAKNNGVYVIEEQSRPVPEFGSVKFDTAGEGMIVGRCASGLASAITVRIDAQEIAEIVGTIAGDDTIFIAIKGREQQDAVLASLASLFGE
jgi:transcriptional regulator of arginine metabolism